MISFDANLLDLRRIVEDEAIFGEQGFIVGHHLVDRQLLTRTRTLHGTWTYHKEI